MGRYGGDVDQSDVAVVDNQVGLEKAFMWRADLEPFLDQDVQIVTANSTITSKICCVGTIVDREGLVAGVGDVGIFGRRK